MVSIYEYISPRLCQDQHRSNTIDGHCDDAMKRAHNKQYTSTIQADNRRDKTGYCFSEALYWKWQSQHADWTDCEQISFLDKSVARVCALYRLCLYEL